MLLSEEFKNKMMRLAGVTDNPKLISEADKRSVIQKSIKFPQELSKEISDWAHNLSDKYSVWIADSFQKLLVKNEIIDKDGKPLENNNDLESGNRRDIDSEIRKAAKDLTGNYQYILDWLKGRNTLAPEHDQINLKTLTIEDAKIRSDEWHKKLKEIQGGKIEGEEGEVIMTFPEGFYWIKIGKDYCPKEASAMGHCGRASGTDLYSLRREQYPFVTAAVRESDGVVTQMKGRANTKPKTQFHKYIIPFIIGSNPNVQYFKSTYAPETDFNINDLNDAELKQVVDKKPTLLMENGKIAIKRLSDKDIQKILLVHPKVFDFNLDAIPLSDILRDDNMVDWAMINAPQLFRFHNWGNVKLSQEQLNIALSDKNISSAIYLDKINIDEKTLNWIVTNRPEMFEESVHMIYLLNDSQKDYLLKNHPKAFESLLKEISHENKETNKKILEFLGSERLQKLFYTNPELFAVSERIRDYEFWSEIITPKLMTNYIKTRNVENDPLKILTNPSKFYYFNDYVDFNTAMYVLVHYPELFFDSKLIFKANYTNGGALGRYIIDHHFDWIEKFNGTLNLQDWNLDENQKQKLINYDIKENTTILTDLELGEDSYRKFNFTPKQKAQILELYEEKGELNLDMILGFDLSADVAKKYIVYVIENTENEFNDLITRIKQVYGEDYIHLLYKEYPKAFNSLALAIEFKDVNRLKEYNNTKVSYTESVIKIRFDDWTDDDLIDLFSDPNQAKTIANFDLDLYGYDYKFNDIDYSFKYLNRLNVARVKFLLGKAYPEEFKEKIKYLNTSQLADIISDPDSISEDSVEYNSDIIEGIKDAFTIAMEDAQRNADENEYWKLFIRPIESFFGKSDFVDIKTQKKGGEIENKQMLQFEISYKKFLDLLNESLESDPYEYNDGKIDLEDYAGNIMPIIKSAIQASGDEFEIKESNYGVNGDVKNEDVNENFSEQLFSESTLKPLLDRAKVVVKNKIN